MVVLRPTRKLLHSLPLTPGPLPASDTALGDWYVNRLVVDHRPLLLLLSSQSLLAVITPARDVRALAIHLPGMIAARLKRLGVPERLVAAEISAMAPVVVAKTEDRSVLGTMVDFAKVIPFHLEVGGWDDTTLPFVELRLGETPCRLARRFNEVIFPGEDSLKRLLARWPAA